MEWIVGVVDGSFFESVEAIDFAQVAGSRDRDSWFQNGKSAGLCRRLFVSSVLSEVYHVISICQVVLEHSKAIDRRNAVGLRRRVSRRLRQIAVKNRCEVGLDAWASWGAPCCAPT